MLALRTGRLPSEWAAEFVADERGVWTVIGLMQEQDRQRNKS